jgi:PIN domain nuclease of toxin-antitoxin system
MLIMTISNGRVMKKMRASACKAQCLKVMKDAQATGEPVIVKPAKAIRSSSQEGGLAIAAITLWELAWIATHRKVSFPGTPASLVETISSRTAVLPLTLRIAVLADELPARYSSDPCDRLTAATALAEGISLPKIRRFVLTRKSPAFGRPTVPDGVQGQAGCRS